MKRKMIDEFVGKTLAGKYRVEEILRSSDLGNIYRGTHLLMEKPVTIKILAPALAVDESIVQQFSVEARTISRLSHPNILNVTDFGKDENSIVFIVMEDAEGELLKEAIQNGEGTFSVEKSVKIAIQMAAALESAHSNGLVHGEFTSDKVLLMNTDDESEFVKVLDIGSFVRGRKKEFEDENSTHDLAYLSPEQCAEESEADGRSDIYSLGIILYEMLAGEVPFFSEDRTELMLKHAQVPPPPLSAFRDDVPGEVEQIMIRALAKNPDMRYQSVTAFAEDLSEAMRLDSSDSSIVIPKVDAVVANGNAQNNLWKTAFIVLAGVSLLAFGLMYMTNVKQTKPQTVQIDENGLPVKPLNPATGLSERNLQQVGDYPINSMDPNNPLVRPETGGGGDGYDPWANGGRPPVGAPPSVGGGGDYVTLPPVPAKPLPYGAERYIDGEGKEIILVPTVAAPTNSEEKGGAKPEKTPEKGKSTPTPKKGGDKETKTTDKTKPPAKTPVKTEGKPKPKKPVQKPTKTTPAKKKTKQSGKELDT